MCWNHGYKKPVVDYDVPVEQDCSIVSVNKTGKIMLAWPAKTFVFLVSLFVINLNLLTPKQVFC